MRPVRVVPATIALTLLAPLLAVLLGGPAVSASAPAAGTPGTSVAAVAPAPKKKGKYKLYCTLHPSNMKMKVKVR